MDSPEKLTIRKGEDRSPIMNEPSSIPSQTHLFDALPIIQPEGLSYAADFLSRAEEMALISLIQTLPLKEMRYKDYIARRRVISFGGQYDFDANRLQPSAPLIAALEPLRAKIAAWARTEESRFKQVLIAEYRPGTPLGWHRDVPDFEDVVGVSLLNEAAMRFRPYPPSGSQSKQILKITLEPRSIYLLRGPARWDWQHSVPPVNALRYSITLRTVSKGRAPEPDRGLAKPAG
jgi:alkylated DNA repair dioxygenase AlkB